MSVATRPPTSRPAGASAPARGAPERRRVAVRGVVQGVGFRPFVWNLATRLGLGGLVCNTSGAVLIEVEGDRRALDAFAVALRDDAPRLARIDSVETAPLEAIGERDFRIVESRAVDGDYQPIAPDAATVEDAAIELRDRARAAILRELGEPDLTCSDDTAPPPHTEHARSVPASRS